MQQCETPRRKMQSNKDQLHAQMMNVGTQPSLDAAAACMNDAQDLQLQEDMLSLSCNYTVLGSSES